jgi:acetaldehyde dehydrogenase (acetylating)
VGPGNVPVLIDTSADVEDAVTKVVAGKSFDYGTVCSSEQAIVAEESLRDRILAALRAQKAFLANDAQRDALGKLLILPNWTVNPKCVGQAPGKIAKMAGFDVPVDTSIVCVEIGGIGKQHPLSAEKLSPVLSLYFVKDFAAAMEACYALLKFGGLGHTTVIYAKDDARVRQFGLRMPAMRVLVNTPAPQGSTGITTNVFPAMTLGCGAAAGNATSDNIGPMNLINVKRLAYAVREAKDAFETPVEGAVPVNGSVDRRMVSAAVERYLAARGVPAANRPDGTPVSNIAAEVVDRFLADRAGRRSRDSSLPTDPQAPELVPAALETTAEAVEFVCEADVRTAIRENRKIHIGPKTIVTPSARELAAPSDILVVAQG